MTIATDAGWNSAAAAPAAGVVYLIELAFTTGTLRLTNWPLDLVTLGATWQGLGTVAEVGDLQESEDGQYQKLTLTLSQVQAALLALALGGVETYQGRAARIWVALLDATTYQLAGAPVLRFAGVMDMVRIERSDDNVGRVMLDCQAGAYDVRSNPAALRLNQAQHAAAHPGETGYRYITDLLARPQQWLSARFQRID